MGVEEGDEELDVGGVDTEQAGKEKKKKKKETKVETWARIDQHSIDTQLAQEKLLPLIEELSALSWGETWGNPFNVKITKKTCGSLGIPDYFNHVTKAMDLLTIKAKLEKGQYARIAELTQDMVLLVRNAQTYNREGEAVHGFAKEVGDKYRTTIFKVMKKELKARSKKPAVLAAVVK